MAAPCARASRYKPHTPNYPIGVFCQAIGSQGEAAPRLGAETWLLARWLRSQGVPSTGGSHGRDQPYVGAAMLYLFNNCRNEDHSALYGGNAFFDLWTTGREANIPNELKPGDICWVASYEGATGERKRRVVLAKYTFTAARRVPGSDAPGRSIWVLDGKLEHREVLPKHQAALHHPCSRFFNQQGDFKQVSVLRVGEQQVEGEAVRPLGVSKTEAPIEIAQDEETIPHPGSFDQWRKVGLLLVALLAAVAAFMASSTAPAIVRLAIGGGALVLFYLITRAGQSDLRACSRPPSSRKS